MEETKVFKPPKFRRPVPMPPIEAMKENRPLGDIVCEIHSRGNDVEIRECKDGVKVIEVQRKVIAII